MFQNLTFKRLASDKVPESYGYGRRAMLETRDLVGGESGIRTHEPREGLLVFKTSVFNRSTISPRTVVREGDRVKQPIFGKILRNSK